MSLGVIYDNQKEYVKAIENYKLYADLCEEVGDLPGLACALNCLGVDYMFLSTPANDPGFVGSKQVVQRSEEVNQYLTQAAACHTKHKEIGPDSGGRFVAGTNLGLCLGMLGDISNSAKHHQDALYCQDATLWTSIAVGNLGNLASSRTTSARRAPAWSSTCVVQASGRSGDQCGKMLADLSTREENFESL